MNLYPLDEMSADDLRLRFCEGYGIDGLLACIVILVIIGRVIYQNDSI